MIFHLGFDIPKPETKELAHDSPDLTSEEIRILKKQIRDNARLIDTYVDRLDLLVNKERYPRKAIFLNKMRQKLFLLMEENDTFRKVLWTHYQKEDVLAPHKLARS